MPPKHIILVNQQFGEFCTISILLQIKGYRVTEVPCLEEAINWVKTLEKLNQKAHLLLIAYCDTRNSPTTINVQQAFSSLSVPLLVVDRKENRHFFRYLPDELGNLVPVQFCPPDLVSRYSEQLLKTAPEGQGPPEPMSSLDKPTPKL